MSDFSAQVGETWKLHHSRKGPLTIRFTEIDDEWATGEIVTGRVRYMSDMNNMLQATEGQGTPGDTITFRKSFVNLIERVQAQAA